jgi:hypothetical protein
MRLQTTELGHTVLHEGERVFDDMREEFVEDVSEEPLAAFENVLRYIVGEDRVRIGAPGWTAHGLNDDGATASVIALTAPLPEEAEIRTAAMRREARTPVLPVERSPGRDQGC